MNPKPEYEPDISYIGQFYDPVIVEDLWKFNLEENDIPEQVRK